MEASKHSWAVLRAACALALTVGLLALGAAVAAAPSQAHQNGCHRWHSCPSDTGSYVCGDLGYYTYCPGSTGGGSTPPAAAPTSNAPADGATFVLGQGSGIPFTVESSTAPSIRISRDTGRDAYGVLSGSAYPVILSPGPVAGTFVGTLSWSLFSGSYPILTAGTYYWQPYLIDASACATNGCYLVGPVSSFTVAPAAAQAPASSQSEATAACASDKGRVRKLAKLVRVLQRQLARTHAKARRTRLKRKLHSRSSALANARGDVAFDC